MHKLQNEDVLWFKLAGKPMKSHYVPSFRHSVFLVNKNLQIYWSKSAKPIVWHQLAPKKNTGHGNEVLPQDTTHLIQRPCYQQGNMCQDPAGNRTTRRPPDDRKETQTAVVWSCFPFIRSGKNHLARHSERGMKTRQTEEEAGRQHQGMDRPGVRQVQEGSGKQGKMEKTGCEIICGAPTILAVKGKKKKALLTLHAVYTSAHPFKPFSCIPQTGKCCTLWHYV